MTEEGMIQSVEDSHLKDGRGRDPFASQQLPDVGSACNPVQIMPEKFRRFRDQFAMLCDFAACVTGKADPTPFDLQEWLLKKRYGE